MYFLFCNDDGSNSVYIGESEDMLERLRQHLKEYQIGSENFCWNTVVAFTGQYLSKALIRYLEGMRKVQSPHEEYIRQDGL
ncbi:MAG: hypothetical protein IJR63_09415 [Synergistaceae bacterium]|nr:hypothetical protein [Synergistaceae bacterium]